MNLVNSPTMQVDVSLTCAGKSLQIREAVSNVSVIGAMDEVLNKHLGIGKWSRSYAGAAGDDDITVLVSDGFTTIRGHGERRFAWCARATTPAMPESN